MSAIAKAHGAQKRYLVRAWTTQSKQERFTHLEWDGAEALGFGMPLRWVMEAVDGKLCLRDLFTSAQSEVLSVEEACEKRLQLENDVKLMVELKEVRTLEAYTAQGPATETAALYQKVEGAVSRTIDPENEFFKKNLQISFGAFAVLALVSLFTMSRAEQAPEELIPAQYAKIVMTKPSAPAVKEAQTNANSAASSAAAPIKASKSLQSFVKRLSARTDILRVSETSITSKQMLSSTGKNNILSALSKDLGSGKAVQVAAIGSAAMDGIAGAIGYGHGEHAQVGGQGKGFVAFDSGAGTVEEGLTRDEVGKVIHSHMQEIRYCYESAMVRDPSSEGRLLVDFTIGGAGAVKVANVQQTTIKDEQLNQCIVSHLISWKFPQPKGGVNVAVAYPFIFKSLGK